MARALGRLLLIGLALGLALLTGGQMGLFSGQRPADLGVTDGRLKPAPATPNCVSSQASGGYHAIAPLAYAGDGAAAFARLRAIVAGMARIRIVREESGYLHAEARSKLLGFVDDVEFHLDDTAAVIHVRSASRLGRKDFGVNRARIEAIRRRMAAGG